MMRSMRHTWEISTASSGPEALGILGREPFDVVVTDMRMPGMDGAQLLAEVKKRYPEIVRIVLSGQSDREMILKSVRPAHQYLAKPCSDEILKSAIERSCRLKDLLAKKCLKQLVSRIDSIPSLPDLYLEILEELESPYTSIHKIGSIISQDIGMTAKILQLVNSAFFGFRRHISGPTEAVELLGLETIKALVLSLQIFCQLDPARLNKFNLERIWLHSLATGKFAKIIATAEKLDRVTVNDAFMAGMLHDAGKIILAVNLPKVYQETIKSAQSGEVSLVAAERQTFGVTHAEVGAYLFALWGLPFPIVEAVAFHHAPQSCPQQELGILTAVYVGNSLEKLLHEGEGADWQPDQSYLSELNVLHKLPVWQALCHQSVAEGGEHGA